ncbi:family 78 glycoside hydrolase catalytic domain [candidate division KSB1 bacterium]|nr:family 78 glycoside hydrolase catalytic domain [candidate division KSB1 bacterium]
MDAPTQLTCELMAYPDKTVIFDSKPEFGWILTSQLSGDYQTAYQILVASSMANLDQNMGDFWDSGKVKADASINIEYEGKPLISNSVYYWKVRVWDKKEKPGVYSTHQLFRTGNLEQPYQTAFYPLEKHVINPVKFIQKNSQDYFIDFGRAAFGTLQIAFPEISTARRIEIHLGEKLKAENTIDPQPGGTIRYRKIPMNLEPDKKTYILKIPPDERNTREAAIKMPDEIGEVLPFRYCEIKNCPSKLDKNAVKQIAVNYPFQDDAAYFRSSDTTLNAVWDLCKYSIKATSFCGVYVDGDRERIPYEADAYINQLSHYAVDREFSMARLSHEYLITHPTWPTEWILHSVLMAWTDYLYTGNKESISFYYNDLKAKTLTALAREDGLISTRTGLVTESVLKSIHFNGNLRDIVDWPPGSFTDGGTGETDGFVFTDYNTVVNAFHYQALVLMHQIAIALEKNTDADFYSKRAEQVKKSFQQHFFDGNRQVYRDGIGTDHAALHANMFPLAFGLVPPESEAKVVEFIKSRGMACSVYGAQYLLEALYAVGEADYALYLMTNRSDRSWPHAIYNVGTTITLEAWDMKYKKNLDWNHAWGAAPANIIPRGLMGVQPLEPGFGKIQIKPQPGNLSSGKMTVPTIRGAIKIEFRQETDKFFELKVHIPVNCAATVYLPKINSENLFAQFDGKMKSGKSAGDFICFENVLSGEHIFMTKNIKNE